MFVVCFESVIVSARRRSLASMGLLPDPLPRLRTARWLLSPSTTWDCWRRQILAPGGEEQPRRFPVNSDTTTSATRTPQRASAASTAVPHSSQPGLERVLIVRRLLRDDPRASTKQIEAALASHGHLVSVRTAQRLRAQATRNESPVPQQEPLKAVQG